MIVMPRKVGSDDADTLVDVEDMGDIIRKSGKTTTTTTGGGGGGGIETKRNGS